MKTKVDRTGDNYYGLDHVTVNKKYEGELTYVATFSIAEEYQPVAVYRCASPNLLKGYKEYVLFHMGSFGQMYVRGMTFEEISKYRFRNGIKCRLCGDVVYSVMRHDAHHCKCGTCFIDGGSDYVRYSGPVAPVKIDLLSQTGEYEFV